MIKPARDTWTISSCIIALALILLPPVQNAASAATYYVAKTGNNANTCAQAQSTATPKLTIASGLTCVGADDTLYIRNGTYDEYIDSNDQTIPTGTSWANAPIISSYTGEKATVRGGVNLPHAYIQYVSFENLILDGQNSSDLLISVGSSGAHHIQFKNCEVKNSAHHGVFFNAPGHHFIFTGGSVHHIGNTALFPYPQWGHYGFYISSPDSLVEYAQIYNTLDFGIHNYNGDSSQVQRTNRNVFRSNIFHHNATLRPSGAALLMSVGDSLTAYNNIFYSNTGHGIVLGTMTPVTNAKVYNNTIYGGAQTGIQIKAATGAEIRNNIIYLNNGGTIDATGGTGTIQDHNLTTDPLFVNAAAQNFRLQAGSAAIDAGATLSTVTTDFARLLRPQGSAFDIGAYEFSANQSDTPPAAPMGLTIQ